MSDKLFIGVMSGTSIDSLDAALCRISQNSFKLIASHTIKWDESVHTLLHSLCSSSSDEIEKMPLACNSIAEHEARVVTELLDKANISADKICAIGTHGQTVRHRPEQNFSLQLDNGPMVAAITGIDTIVNFRAADLANAGQGAPLTPIFHKLLLSKQGVNRFVLNLGGISNITALDDKGGILCGFDCGPANTLLDLCCREILHLDYDADAKVSSQGHVVDSILNELLQNSYLSKPFPKSTGREDFNRNCIAPYLDMCKAGRLAIEDLLYTLSVYTVKCVSLHIEAIVNKYKLERGGELVLCGGGALNPLIVRLFEKSMLDFDIKTYISQDFGIDASYLEAQAFAYFAYLFVSGIAPDIKDCTGATRPSILGCLCPATDGCYSRRLK